MTTAVLIAAVLFVQSVAQALAVGPGFDADRVVFATAQTRYRFMRDDGPVLAARTARDLTASLDVFEQIKSLTAQNQKLRTARDLLLPRLMSGELAV